MFLQYAFFEVSALPHTVTFKQKSPNKPIVKPIYFLDMFQENVSRLGGKYSDCVPDDADWQDLRDGRVVTIKKGKQGRYDRKV